MKVKYLIPILMVMLVFSFTFISCSSNNLEKKVTDLEQELKGKNQVINELGEELRITKKDLELTQKELDKKIEEEKEQLAKGKEEQGKPKIQELRIGDEIIFSEVPTGDGICSVIIHSIENFTDYGKYDAPNEGMRDIAFDVEVKNLSDEVQAYHCYNYALRDADYYRYDNPGGGRKEPRLSTGDLAPNDKMRGWVTIEIPEDIVITEILASPCYCEPPAIIKIVPSLSP